MPANSVAPSRLRPHPRPAAVARAVAGWLGPHAAIVLTGAGGVALVTLFAWIASEVYENLLKQGWLVALDRPILDWMIAHRTPWLDEAVTVWTTIGGPVVTPIVAGAAVVFLSWHWRSWLPLLMMAVATAGALGVTLVGKAYVARVRPPHELAVPPYEWSPSFPSGHALNSVVIGGVIAYLLWRRFERPASRWTFAVVAALYAFAMGLSRIYLGHHWTSDVVVGWALGLAWLGAVITMHSVAVEVKEHRALPRSA